MVAGLLIGSWLCCSFPTVLGVTAGYGLREAGSSTSAMRTTLLFGDFFNWFGNENECRGRMVL
eukprot:3194955-Amphidinium_carterae.1